MANEKSQIFRKLNNQFSVILKFKNNLQNRCSVFDNKGRNIAPDNTEDHYSNKPPAFCEQDG